MERKIRFLVFLAAGIVVVISCILIVVALVTYHRISNMSQQMAEQLQMTDRMQEDLFALQFPEITEIPEQPSPRTAAPASPAAS